MAADAHARAGGAARAWPGDPSPGLEALTGCPGMGAFAREPGKNEPKATGVANYQTKRNGRAGHNDPADNRCGAPAQCL